MQQVINRIIERLGASGAAGNSGVIAKGLRIITEQRPTDAFGNPRDYDDIQGVVFVVLLARLLRGDLSRGGNGEYMDFDGGAAQFESWRLFESAGYTCRQSGCDSQAMAVLACASYDELAGGDMSREQSELCEEAELELEDMIVAAGAFEEYEEAAFEEEAAREEARQRIAEAEARQQTLDLFTDESDGQAIHA